MLIPLNGTALYQDRYAQCWVYASLTTPAGSPEQALLTMAERILARIGKVPFEDYVAVHNLVRYGGRDGGHLSSYNFVTPIFDRSPLLQLRRLQIVDRATRAMEPGKERVWREPLRMAWVFGNQDVLRYYELEGGWYVFADKYWELYEKYQNTEWAEEMAWSAAKGDYQTYICDGPCILANVAKSLGRYWSTFPSGRWVKDALAEAERLVAKGVNYGCMDSTAAAAGESADFLLETLKKVEVPEKEQLLLQVALVVQACGVEHQ